MDNNLNMMIKMLLKIVMINGESMDHNRDAE